MASTTFTTRALTAALFTLLAWAATPFTTQAQLPDYLPTEGLVGWWPFNGNANDESGNGNDGTVNGPTLTSDRFGLSNSAFHFNNSGSIQAGNFQFQNYVSSGFSVSYWFTMEDSTTTNRHFLITNYDGINGLQIEYGPSSTNTLRHSLRTGTGTPPEINYHESFLVFNTWKHAVMVWSPPIMSTYINGVLTNQTTGNQITNLSVCCNVKTQFGSPWGTTNDNHKGKLDDIGIWNRALTQQEITALYTGIPYIAPCADPTACNFEQEGECVFAEPNLDCAGNCLNDCNNNGICDEDEVYGCEYPTACNYNPEANVGDGSCIFPAPNYDCDGNCLLDLNNNGLCDLDEVAGCTNIDAVNYNAEATLDDGSCITTCKGDFNNDGEITSSDLLSFLAAFGNQCAGAGCMDPAGCNYDPTATFDLGYCEYPAEFFNCDGTPINDADGDGIPDELEVAGCTDPEAGNYNPDATDDDGSCAAAQPQYPEGSVFCNGTPTEVVEVLNPATGRIWMDRNLGATQAATSSTDEAAYGDLYQWGRGSDGHQCRNSTTTSALSSADTPSQGNFILAPNAPNDWRSPQNDNLWQGVNGVNNLCPSGYRLPTEPELNAERLSWSSNNAAGAFASPLRLSAAGGRGSGTGELINVGSFGSYWSSSVSGVRARYLQFNSSNANLVDSNRASGRSVRCIKE